ncbi:hypothetical protein ATKI12_1843 [Kitasatospora sp. Ki12]
MRSAPVGLRRTDGAVRRCVRLLDDSVPARRRAALRCGSPAPRFEATSAVRP